MPGGRLDQPTREATIGVRADITGASQLAALPLTAAGASTSQAHVGDVARITDGYVDHRFISTVGNRDSVLVYVARDSDSDTVGTTASVRAAFKDLAKKYSALHFNEVGADNEFTMQSINGVLQNLGEGIVLTAIVLLLFLHVWRSALVVLIAIPSSLLATFFVAWMLGFTIDVLSLMGLSLTIGILVDDSIVVIENITRHRELGEGAEDAAIAGRSEIGGAAVAITLVDVVVFAPIALMSGIIGQYMKEFGLVDRLRDAVLAARLVHAHAAAGREVGAGAQAARALRPHAVRPHDQRVPALVRVDQGRLSRLLAAARDEAPGAGVLRLVRDGAAWRSGCCSCPRSAGRRSSPASSSRTRSGARRSSPCSIRPARRSA